MTNKERHKRIRKRVKQLEEDVEELEKAIGNKKVEKAGHKPPSKRPGRLDNCIDVRRFLARVAREVYMGKLDPKPGNTCVLACNGILGSLRNDEMEKELERLKSFVREMRNKRNR